jgi:hypothetical protein
MGEREFTRNARTLVLEYYDGCLSKEDETPISETEFYLDAYRKIENVLIRAEN